MKFTKVYEGSQMRSEEAGERVSEEEERVSGEEEAQQISEMKNMNYE